MVCKMLPIAEKMVWKRFAMAETMELRQDATAVGGMIVHEMSISLPSAKCG